MPRSTAGRTIPRGVAGLPAPANEVSLIMNTFWQSFVKKVALFEHLSNEQVGIVADFCEEILYREGQFVFRECDASDDLLIVTEGIVAMGHDLGMPGVEDEITCMHPGDVFGEMGLFDDLPRSMDARVRTDARLLRIRKVRWQALIGSDPALGLKLLENVARCISFRLRTTNWELVLVKAAQADRG